MARRYSSGFELNSLTANVEWTAITGSPTIQSAITRTGNYALRANVAAATADARYTFNNGSVIGQTIFARAYVYIGSAPGTLAIVMSFSNGATQRCSIRMNSNRTLELWNGSAQIGSDSAALTAGQWYRLEMKAVVDGSGTVTEIEGKIDGVAFASATSQSIGAIDSLRLGVMTSTTADLYFDDVAINDATGSFQNSYPGEGRIVHLKPRAAGDNNGFTTQTGGTAGAANNWSRVSEVTPDDATSFNGANTAVTDDFKIETPYWLSSDATINVLQVGTRFRESTATGTGSTFVPRLKAVSGGTVEEGTAIPTNGTTWLTNAAAAPRNYGLTVYDMPGASTTPWTRPDLETAQIGYRISTAAANRADITAVWLLVEFVQGSKIYVDKVHSAEVTGTNTLTISGVEIKGANRKVVIGVSGFDGTTADRDPTGITVAGNAATEIAGASLDSDAGVLQHNSSLWYYDNPAVGNANVVITMGGTADAIEAGAIVLGNAATGAPEATDEDALNSTTTFQSSLATLTADDIIINNTTLAAGPSVAGADTTLVWNLGGNTSTGGVRFAPTATTYTIGVTTAASDNGIPVSAAFKTVVAGTTSSQTQDIRATGQQTSSRDQDARLTGRDTSSRDQDLRATGRDTSSQSQDVRTTGRDTSSTDRDVRAMGAISSSDARDVRATGQATSSHAQDVRTTGQLIDSRSQDVRVRGQATDNRSQDTRVTGQDTSTRTQDVRAAGAQASNDNRDVRATGTATDNRNQDIRTTGQQTDSRSQDVRTQGQASSSADRDTRITGQDTSSTNRDLRTTGANGSARDQDARLIGTATDSRNQDVRTAGQQTSQTSQDIKTSGAAGSNESRDLRTTGTATDSQQREVRLQGQATSSDVKDLRATGQATNSHAQDVRVTGRESSDTSREVRLTGDVNLSSIEEAIRVTGQTTDTREQTIRATGQDFSFTTLGIYLVAQAAPPGLYRRGDDLFDGAGRAYQRGNASGSRTGNLYNRTEGGPYNKR